MRKCFLICLLTLSLVFTTPAQADSNSQPDWEPVGTGIAYREYFLKDPNHVFVARMDRSEQLATIESSIAQGRLSGGTETVLGMAKRYDEVINYWGNSDDTSRPYWGARNHVVVAINGYFFDPKTGVPWQGQVYSGWYAKRFDNNLTRTAGSGFAWQLDREAFIGECVVNDLNKNYITFADGTTTLPIDAINVGRGQDQLVLYTPQYDRATPPNDSGVEVLVEVTRPTLLVAGSGVAGNVEAIKQGSGSGSTPIPFDHIVLSASDAAADFLLAHVQLGDTLHVSQEIRRCNSTYPPVDWTKTYASVGGSFYFLKDGVINGFLDDGQATVRNPRTAIAFDDNYVYFIVVDGRDPDHSAGMTIQQLGEFARDTLGARWGIAQDGGGSSTMVINGEVKNNTYCNNVFGKAHVYLPLVSAPAGQAQPEPPANLQEEIRDRERQPAERTQKIHLADQTESLDNLARAVANGMLMVVIEPISQSVKLDAGQIVTATAATNVYLGPGSNYGYAQLDDQGNPVTVPAGSQGEVLPQANGLDGVLARGAFWWKVQFGSLAGWVNEQNILPPTPGPAVSP